MDQTTIDLFSQALNITSPWYVDHIDFSKEEHQMDIYVKFKEDGVFICPTCGSETGSIHDVHERTWRHLNFFQYKCYIHCQLPRIFCKVCNKVQVVEAPWARKGSGFTLMMEGLILLLTDSMTYSEAGNLIDEEDKRVFRVVKYYVKKAHNKLDCSDVTSIGVDETSKKKGHNYFTVVANMDTGAVLYVTDGKDSDTIENFRSFLVAHGGDSSKIENVCCDMSPSFIKGIDTCFPGADIVFDKFHLMMMINNAVNEVRIAEKKENDDLKGSKYIFLKNPENLTEKEKKKFESISNQNLKTLRAYHIRLEFQKNFWKSATREDAEKYLKKWYFWITHSKLKPMKELAKTIKRHWNGILNYFYSRITNGILEGINSQIQAIKRAARGFKNLDNFKTAIYHRLGRLELEISVDIFETSR